MTHRFARIFVSVVAGGCTFSNFGCPFAAPIVRDPPATEPVSPATDTDVENPPVDGACCGPDCRHVI